MQLFGSLNLLMALLGSSWPLLGPIWPQNGPRNRRKSGPNSDEKIVQQKWPNKWQNKWQLGAPKWTPKLSKTLRPGHGDFWTGVSKKLLVPRCFQDAPRWVQIAQDSPQDSPRWLQIAQDRHESSCWFFIFRQGIYGFLLYKKQSPFNNSKSVSKNCS